MRLCCLIYNFADQVVSYMDHIKLRSRSLLFSITST